MTQLCWLKVSLHRPKTGEPLQEWTFERQRVIKIGRSTCNDIVLYSSTVSRYHVVLSHVSQGWKLESLGMNGTFVDGQEAPETWIERDGTQVRLGRTGPLLRLWLKDPQLAPLIRQHDWVKRHAVGTETYLEQSPTPVSRFSVSPVQSMKTAESVGLGAGTPSRSYL